MNIENKKKEDYKIKSFRSLEIIRIIKEKEKNKERKKKRKKKEEKKKEEKRAASWFSTSTSIILYFFLALEIKRESEPDTARWLSFNITNLSNDILCFSPPPMFTASLSKNRKPGAVFLVA